MTARARVCIMTSSHTAFDERIFHKQAKSLAGAGYEVTIVAPHAAGEVLDGIRVKAVPKTKGLLKRAFLTAPRVLRAALREGADIYHFHDPELLPAGLLLRLLGKRVIYDAHEYYKQNFLSRRPASGALTRLTANVLDSIETQASRLFNGVIVVDRVTKDKFKGRAVTVSNFPYRPGKPARFKPRGGGFKCVYAGGLSADRGLFKMIEAMEHVDRPARLILLGRVSEEDRLRARKMKGYERVEFLGFRPWPEVLKLLPECDLGLVLLQPVPAYIHAGEGTVKLFEYMASGLPVLGSNFPNLARIIMGEGCGATVNPADPVEIAGKIMYLADNPDVASGMGKNGWNAVMEKYNWEMEAEKLFGLYSRILDECVVVSGRKAVA
jgi:glycosyltransferase involved in cell wall biosynthesis